MTFQFSSANLFELDVQRNWLLPARALELLCIDYAQCRASRRSESTKLQNI